MTDLKDCPFCGGTPTYHEHMYWTTGLRDAWITCEGCGSTYKHGLSSGDALVSAWNRRTETSEEITGVSR